MQRFLEKISWKCRRVEITFSPMFLNWSGSGSYFTFSIFKVHYNYGAHALFEIDLLLPNKTTHKYFQVYSWDFLFIRYFLRKLQDSLSDKNVWNRNKMTRWDKFKLKVLNKIL